MNITDDAPVKPAPVIVTLLPTAPSIGENELTMGVVTVKVPELFDVPPDVVTLTFPEVELLGTVAVI